MLPRTNSSKNSLCLLIISLTVLTTTVAVAVEEVPTSSNDGIKCSTKLTPQEDQLKSILEKKTKTITAVVGANVPALILVTEVADASKKSLFQMNDFYQIGRNTEHNNALLTSPLLQLRGVTPENSNSSIGEWLNKVKKSSGILILDVANLSIKQQRELANTYDAISQQSDFHLLLCTHSIESVIPALRERIGTEVLNTDGAPTEEDKERKQQSRQLAEDILKPQTSLWVRHISTKTKDEGNFLIDHAQSLLKILTAGDIERFHMQGGLPNLDQLHFSEKIGVHVKVTGEDKNKNTEDSEYRKSYSGLSSWLGKADDKIGGPIRLIIIQTPFLSNADKDAMEYWLEEMKTHKNASQFRIILHDFTPGPEVEVDIGIIK